MEDFFLDDIEFSDEEMNFSLLPTPKLNRAEKQENRQNALKASKVVQTNSILKPQQKKFNFVRTSNILRNQKNVFNKDLEQKPCKKTLKENDFGIVLSNESMKQKDSADCGKKTQRKERSAIDLFQSLLDDDDVVDDILSHIDVDSKNEETAKLTKQETRSCFENKLDTKFNNPEYQDQPVLLKNSKRSYLFKRKNITSDEATSLKGNEDICNIRKKQLKLSSCENPRIFGAPKSIPISHVTPKRKVNTIDTLRKECNIKLSTGKRKFPGPAGNLPKMNRANALHSKSPDISIEKRPLTPCTPKTPLLNALNLSQDGDSYNSDLWNEMKQYTSKHFETNTDSIAAVINKARNKQLSKSKVELLYGIVRSFSVSGNSGKMILKDQSGEVTCAVHRDVLEEHQAILKSGTGIVLKDVSVYSPTPKKHYVNITPSNVDRFFLSEPSNESFIQSQCSQNTPDKYSGPKLQIRHENGKCVSVEKESIDKDIDLFFSDDL